MAHWISYIFLSFPFLAGDFIDELIERCARWEGVPVPLVRGGPSGVARQGPDTSVRRVDARLHIPRNVVARLHTPTTPAETAESTGSTSAEEVTDARLRITPPPVPGQGSLMAELGDAGDDARLRTISIPERTDARLRIPGSIPENDDARLRISGSSISLTRCANLFAKRCAADRLAYGLDASLDVA